MALAYRAGSFQSSGNASGGDLALTKPTGTVDGDVVFVLCYFEPDTTTISISPGTWESLAISNTGAFRIHGFWKYASGEPASYTLSNSTAGDQWRIAVGVAYSGGTGTGTLLDVSTSAQADGQLDTGQTAPSATTTGVDRLVVYAYGNFGGNETTGMSGFCTNRRGSLGGLTIADALKATAGATGTSNQTGAGTQDYAAMHIALISDTGGGAIQDGAASVTLALTVAPAGSIIASGAGVGTLVATSAAAGGVLTTGAAAPVIAVTTTPAGTLIASGAATAPIAVTTAAEGFVTRDGAAAASLAVSATATGDLLLSGATATTLDLATSADGSLILSGSVASTLDVDAAAAGALIAAGAATATIETMATADALVTRDGAAAVSLAVTTDATGALLAGGAIATTVDLTTTGDGTLIAAGAVAATVDVTATATGTVTGAGLTAPANLIATAASSSVINLSWDDTNSIEDGTVIERSPDGVGSWAVIGEVGVNVVTFSDTGLPGATQFWFRVKAFQDEAA